MKKIMQQLMTLCLLFGCMIPAQASAFPLQEPKYYGDSTVTVLITLDKPCLADNYRHHLPDGQFSDFSSYLVSEEGKNSIENILSQQQQCQQQIQKTVFGVSFTDSRSYTSLTNAFTAETGLNNIRKLQTLPEVRSVKVLSAKEDTISKKATKTIYSDETLKQEPATEKQQPYDTYGMAYKRSISISDVYDAGYTGKGTLIAVIDSEFDVKHDVFSAAPKDKKYTKEAIRQIAETARLGSEKYKASEYYYNGKIVYAYDYGENDNQCLQSESAHGTHVAGIAAGNSKGKGSCDYKGTAYDAQLALFKISDQSGKLLDEAIIAALDDAYKLSPDVINCSYGAVEYLTHDYEGRQIYEKLMQSGTAVVAASGNDAYNGYQMGMEEIPVSYINYSTVCSPSSMNGALSVAASVPDAVYTNPFFMVFNQKQRVDTEIVYSSLDFDEVYGEKFRSKQACSTDKVPKEIELDKVDYVYIKGSGTKKDFEKSNIKDKIAVINESSLSMETVIRNSICYDCYAVVVIKKEQNSALNIKTDTGDFFVYTVDHSQKEYFEDHPVGKVSIRTTDQLSEKPQENAGTIAEYSSFGMKADLSLKPDITAPGDSIYSSLPNRNYGEMSGTSMASPCTAGAYAIMKQYLTESGIGENLSPYMEEEYIYQLLMSTAGLLQYKNTDKALYYSPRLQGAGCIDLSSAVSTQAYLSVDGKRPSISLSENEEGRYSFHFTVTNRADTPIQFSLSEILQTDGYQKAKKPKNGINYVHTFVPENIRNDAEIRYYVNGEEVQSIALPPAGEITVTVKLELDAAFIANHSKIFTNGFYIDGFICLQSEENPQLSIPFSGFCGDWNSGSIFPKNIYNEKAVFPAGTSTLAIVSSFNPESSFAQSAGINVFGYEDLPSIISFGTNSLRSYLTIPDNVYTTSCVLLPDIYILRDAMDYTISIYDQEQNLLFCQNFGDISSYFSPYDLPHSNFTEKSKSELLRNYYEFTEGMEEGRYTYLLSAARVGTDGNPEYRDLMSFKVYVDNTRPKIENYYLERNKDGRLILTVNAKDNYFLQGIRLSAVQFNNEGQVAGTIDLLDEMRQNFGSNNKTVRYQYDESTGKYVFQIDLTNYKQFIQKKKKEQAEIYHDDDLTIIFENEKDYSMVDNSCVMIEAVDTAYNCSGYELIDVDSYGKAVIQLKDEKGQPLSGITLVLNQTTYTSDALGIIKANHLPSGKNIVSLPSEYVTMAGESTFTFYITKGEPQYEEKLLLKKADLPEADDSSQERESSVHDIRIINYPTGSEDETVRQITAVIGCMTALFVIIGVLKKTDSSKRRK